MRRTLGITLVACAITLAGCDSQEHAAQPPPTPESSAAATTTPSPENGPPELPERAKQKSAAGAKAFVRYYVDLLNYSVTHNSILGMPAAHTAGCTVCQRFISSIQQNARKGGSQTGGEWTIKASTLVGDLDRPIVVTRVVVGVGEVVTRSGARPRRIPRHGATFQFRLAHSDAPGWRVRDVRDV